MWKTFFSLSFSMLLRTKSNFESQQQLTNKKKDSIFFNKKSMFFVWRASSLCV